MKEFISKQKAEHSKEIIGKEKNSSESDEKSHKKIIEGCQNYSIKFSKLASELKNASKAIKMQNERTKINVQQAIGCSLQGININLAGLKNLLNKYQESKLQKNNIFRNKSIHIGSRK